MRVRPRVPRSWQLKPTETYLVSSCARHQLTMLKAIRDMLGVHRRQMQRGTSVPLDRFTLPKPMRSPQLIEITLQSSPSPFSVHSSGRVPRRSAPAMHLQCHPRAAHGTCWRCADLVIRGGPLTCHLLRRRD